MRKDSWDIFFISFFSFGVSRNTQIIPDPSYKIQISSRLSAGFLDNVSSLFLILVNFTVTGEKRNSLQQD